MVTTINIVVFGIPHLAIVPAVRERYSPNIISDSPICPLCPSCHIISESPFPYQTAPFPFLPYPISISDSPIFISDNPISISYSPISISALSNFHIEQSHFHIGQSHFHLCPIQFPYKTVPSLSQNKQIRQKDNPKRHKPSFSASKSANF